MKILSEWERHFALQTSNFCTSFTQPSRSAWCIIIVGVVFMFNCIIHFCLSYNPHDHARMPHKHLHHDPHQIDFVFASMSMIKCNTQAALGRMVAKNTQQLLDCAQVKTSSRQLKNIKTFKSSRLVKNQFFSAAAPGCPFCKCVPQQDWATFWGGEYIIGCMWAMALKALGSATQYDWETSADDLSCIWWPPLPWKMCWQNTLPSSLLYHRRIQPIWSLFSGMAKTDFTRWASGKY